MSVTRKTDRVEFDLDISSFEALLSMLRRSNPRTPEEMFVYTTVVEGWDEDEFEDGDHEAEYEDSEDDEEEEADTEPDEDEDYGDRFP